MVPHYVAFRCASAFTAVLMFTVWCVQLRVPSHLDWRDHIIIDYILATISFVLVVGNAYKSGIAQRFNWIFVQITLLLFCCVIKKKTPHLTFKWLRIQSPPSLPNIHILIYDCRSIWVLFENLISTWLTKRVYTFRFCSVDRKLKRIGRRNELVRLIESLCGSADLIVPSALCYYRATSKGTFEYPASHPLPPATIQRSWRAGATHPVVPFGLWFSIRTVIWWPSAPLWL